MPQLQPVQSSIPPLPPHERTRPPTPWGFHESTLDTGPGVAAAVNAALGVLDDPRNAWMGLGALGMVKGPGWGTEVLRRYRLLGGTPETLNRTLRNRAIDTDARDRIVTGYRNATDLAAPGPRETGGQDVGTAQHRAMEWAGRGYEERGRQAPQWDWNSNRTYPTSHIDDVTGPPSFEGMKSGSMGNAAYNAVSRQAARLIDEGLLGFKKSTYGPRGRVSDAQYAKEFPIQ